MATHTIPQIKAQTRGKLGSRETYRMRKAGRLPAVIYGHKQQPSHVSFDHKELVHLLHQKAHLIEVSVDASTEPCLVKEVQWDHLGAVITHLDLERVDLNEEVEVEVDLVLVGEAIGLKEAGAFLEHPMTTIEIRCLATKIPDSIKVNVSELKVDDLITVADIKFPQGITTTAEMGTLVAAIHIAAEEPEPTAAADGAAAEPEVIGKKLEEGEEAAAPAEKKK